MTLKIGSFEGRSLCHKFLFMEEDGTCENGKWYKDKRFSFCNWRRARLGEMGKKWGRASRWKKVQLYLIFPLIQCILLLHNVSGERLQPIFRQFVNLIKHCTIQPYCSWNRSTVITCWVKKKEQKLINTNAITRQNAIVISRDQQSWRSNFNLIQTCLQLFSKDRWRNNLKSN